MPIGGAGHLSDRLPMPLGGRLWYYAAELRTLSFANPVYGLALTNTMGNQPEMCPLKLVGFLSVFVPLIIHNLTRAAYSPNGFHKQS